MAQYWLDIENLTDGVLPDWIENGGGNYVFAVSEFDNEMTFRWNISSNTRSSAYFKDSDGNYITAENVEIYANIIDFSAADSRFGIRMNVGGSDGFTIGRRGWSSDTTRRIASYMGGSFNEHAAEDDGISSSTWLHIRVSTQGGSHFVRTWTGDLEDEATATELSTTSTRVTGSGRVGLLAFNASGGTRARRGIGIGTDGDPAPTGPVPVGPTTPTSLITSNITANSFRAGWTP